MPRSPYRIASIREPITLTFDGKPIVAERGEPVAAALIAEGKLTVARSPKFHRPRGPSCFRAACDGCLARVDGVPNVMTCMIEAREGMEIVTQNRVGFREADVLRMTDWFFPDGMNHHELFAGVFGVQAIMQNFARRVAGLGKLPTEALAPRAASRREVDVVVVGSGPSGMAIAGELAKTVSSKPSIEVLDDQLVPGGSVRALSGSAAASFDPVVSAFERAATNGSIRVRSKTVAFGVYEGELLVASEDGAEILRPKALVLACGAHDGVLAFEGNDLPGVMSARAAGFLLERGVLVGERPVVVVPESGGPFGVWYKQSFEARARTGEAQDRSIELVHGTPIRAEGSHRVSSVIVRTASGERELVTDAVLIDAERSPAYELAMQAGGELVHHARGYVVKTERWRIRSGLYAVGELAGTSLDASAIASEAAQVARTIRDDLDLR